MTSSFDQRNTVRQEKLSKRLLLSRNLVKRKGQKVQKKCLEILKKLQLNSFLIYIPIKNEVETGKIIEFLNKGKKEIYLPVFKKARNDWAIGKFSNFDDLEPGPFNILQPKNSSPVDVGVIDCAILPGVAFDKHGVRLGYGKGVYDKLLKNFKGLKIGLAYDFQIVDHLFKENHDVVVDVVVGENLLIRKPI